MVQDKNKAALMNAAKELLENSDKPEQITSRAIAEYAGVNAAMINYYFQSKDKLLTTAVGEIIAASAKKFHIPDPSLPPVKRLQKTLWDLCEIVVRYRRFSKIFIPQILLEGEIDTPFYILPDIREHFKGRKSETECRVIAYEIISFMQLVFYRSEAFYKYTGINLTDQEECKKLFDMELRTFLPED